MTTTIPPGQQRDELLSQLRKTREALMSPSWITRIRKAPADRRTEAAESMLKVQMAILDLENLKLEEIRDDIAANSEELEAATEKLGKALTDLKKVATVLNALSGFLNVIAKVVKLF